MATKNQQGNNYPINDNQNSFNNQSKPVLHHNNHSNKTQNNGYNKNLNYYAQNMPPNQQKSFNMNNVCAFKKKFNNNYNTGYQNNYHNGNYHPKFNPNYNNMNSKSQSKTTFKSFSYNHGFSQNQNANPVDLKSHDSAGNSSTSNSVTPPTPSSNSNSTNTTTSPSSNLASPTAKSLNNVNVSTSNNENATVTNQNDQLNKTDVGDTQQENSSDDQQLNKKIVEDQQSTTVANNLVRELSNLQVSNNVSNTKTQQTMNEKNHAPHSTNNSVSFKTNGGQQTAYLPNNVNNNGGKLMHNSKELIINSGGSVSTTTTVNQHHKQQASTISGYTFNNSKNAHHSSNKINYNGNYPANNYHNNNSHHNLNNGNNANYQFSNKMNSYSRGKKSHANGGTNNLLNINNKNIINQAPNQSNLSNSVKNATNHQNSSNKLLNQHNITNASHLQQNHHSMITNQAQLLPPLQNTLFYHPAAASFPTNQQHPVAQQHLSHHQSSNLQNHHTQQQPLPNLHPPNCIQCQPSGIYFAANSPSGGQYIIPPPPPNVYHPATAFHQVSGAPLSQQYLSFASYQFNAAVNGNLTALDNVNNGLINYREYRDLNGNVQQTNGSNSHNGNLNNNSNVINHQGCNSNLNGKYSQQPQLLQDHLGNHYLTPAQFAYNTYMPILPNYYANSYLPTNSESQQLNMIANSSTTLFTQQQQLTAAINNNLHSMQQANVSNTVVNNQQQSGQQDQFAIANAANVDTISSAGKHSRSNSNSYEATNVNGGGLLQTTNNQITTFNDQINSNNKFFSTYPIADYNQMTWQNSNLFSNNLNGNNNGDDLSSHNLNVNVNYLQQTVDKTSNYNTNDAKQVTDSNLVDKK